MLCLKVNWWARHPDRFPRFAGDLHSGNQDELSRITFIKAMNHFHRAIWKLVKNYLKRRWQKAITFMWETQFMSSNCTLNSRILLACFTVISLPKCLSSGTSCRIFVSIWGFPEIGVPLHHPSMAFCPYKPTILATPMYGNPHILWGLRNPAPMTW